MLVLLLAGSKIACGLALWMGSAAWTAPTPNLFADWFYLLQLGVFSVASGLLIVGGRSDTRARALGTVLILFASLFIDPLLRHTIAVLSANGRAFASTVYTLQPIAFLPAYYWQFAREFPRPVQEWSGWVSASTVFKTLLAGGWLLLITNLSVPALALDTWAGRVSRTLSRSDEGRLWDILLALSLPSVMLILAHLRSSPEVERRRVRLFLTSLLAGVLPLTLDVLLASLVPAYREYTRATHRIGAVGIGLSLALLIVPIATVYAVLVNRVFDVHFFVRKALQYALARYTLLGLLAVPAVGLASYAYANRDRSIGELLQVQPSVGWVLLIATGLTLVFLRRPLLELLDRQFFREEYDARRVLVALVDGSRRAGSVKEQAALTVREIDRALHVVTVVMLVRDRATNCFVDPQGNLQSLPCDAQLATLIGGAGTPLDATVASSALDRLSTADQDWLSHAHARLFVPVFSSSGSLLGIIAIGEKLSETPFSSEDRELLASVAAAAAMALEHRQLLDSGLSAGSDTPDESPDSDPARQCSSCGIVQQAASERCSRCGGALTAARLPAVLAGTFAIEREIGHGGMGVVYRGRDLKLDRAVALKTLPRVSVSSVNRLRQEALAMAALQDPHLAVIYGAENWRGSPVLILEYLAGGTLADRLRAGPLPVEEVVTLGLAISSALNTIHRSGLLHRDIKPSNIGYTAGGVPKLLDFGLARLVTGVSRILPAGASSTTAHTFSRGHTRETSEKKLMATATQHLAGTAAYLSPEAIAMEPPSASFDLWSLSVTLFEALTGKNPFLGADVQETFYLISFPRLPNWPMVGSNHPTPLISFFRGALSSRREERPASARAFHEALGRCLAGSRATENSTSAA